MVSTGIDWLDLELEGCGMHGTSELSAGVWYNTNYDGSFGGCCWPNIFKFSFNVFTGISFNVKSNLVL